MSPRIGQKLNTKYNSDPNIQGRVLKANLANRQAALDWEQNMVDQAKLNGITLDQQFKPLPSN